MTLVQPTIFDLINVVIICRIVVNITKATSFIDVYAGFFPLMCIVLSLRMS